MEQICRSLPTRASHFAQVVQVSHFPLTFYLEGFQACIEISGAMQAPTLLTWLTFYHICLGFLFLCMLIISENHWGIIDTALNTSAPVDEDVLLQNHCVLTILRK